MTEEPPLRGRHRLEAAIAHNFKAGQSVGLTQCQRDAHEVLRLLPETVSGEPQYRIRSVATATERVVREAEIRSL